MPQSLSLSPQVLVAAPPSRELLIAWLLLLLDRQVTHGYELRRQLHARGVTIEVGAMYRTLRKLEGDGFAASSWASSLAGPRRRLYRLTTKGRRRLTELVAAIALTRDVHAAFLYAHDAGPSAGPGVDGRAVAGEDPRRAGRSDEARQPALTGGG